MNMRVHANTPRSSNADASLSALRVSGKVRLPLNATFKLMDFFLVLKKCLFTLTVLAKSQKDVVEF